MKLGLINYGAGNYSSVHNALLYLKVPTIEISNSEQMENATHFILPGVGTFASAMNKLKQLNLIDSLRIQILENRKPFLGICVGMQILATIGNEHGKCDGLNWIKGSVDRINIKNSDLKLPHIGWNELESINKQCALFNGLSENPVYYFVHSFKFTPENIDAIAGSCVYGELIPAIIQRENIFGVQFHPEKSQHDGLKLIKNFSEIT